MNLLSNNYYFVGINRIEMSEKTRLLRKKKANSSLKFKYKCQTVKSKGAILVLLWDAIFNMHYYMMNANVIYLVAYNTSYHH